MNMRIIIKNRVLTVLVFTLCVLILQGCRTNEHAFEEEYLVRCGEETVTVGEYYKALEIAKTAYSHSTLRNKETFKKIQLRLLSQMAEELIIKLVARERNITVSDEELKQAVDDIKKDYPDDVFDEVLLENAVSYELWEDRLKKQILMKKVVAAELDSDLSITPEMMEEYYKKNIKEIKTDLEQGTEAVYEKLIRRMRSEKKQEAYQLWIDKKKSDYSIEVNEKIWEKIVGS